MVWNPAEEKLLKNYHFIGLFIPLRITKIYAFVLSQVFFKIFVSFQTYYNNYLTTLVKYFHINFTFFIYIYIYIYIYMSVLQTQVKSKISNVVFQFFFFSSSSRIETALYILYKLLFYFSKFHFVDFF